MIRVEAIIDDNPYIISAFCSSIKREDDIKSLGVKLSFDYLNNKVIDKNTVWIDLSLGNTIMLYDDDTLLFQGTIQKAARNGLGTYQYEAYDNAWYLNKQEARIQFSNVDVKTAIETLCKQENIPCDVACDISTKVTKIYNMVYTYTTKKLTIKRKHKLHKLQNQNLKIWLGQQSQLNVLCLVIIMYAVGGS